MLKVVKTPPLATVVSLRSSPRAKGKVKEKKYYRSTKPLKFRVGAMPTMQTSFQTIMIPYKFTSICKACSSILSYGLFWGIIYGITASFLKLTLNVSSGTTTTTMLGYYLTWMMEPISGLIFGCLFTIWISSPQENSVKLTRQFWARLLSAAPLVGSSMIFFICIPRLADESSSAEIILSTMFTVICFAVMMISINGHMSAMNLMTQPEAGGNAAHYGLTSGLNAVGQMIAMGIIIYFGLNNNNNNNNNNNSVDNVAPAILGVGSVFISIFIIISLICGQYCIYDKWCTCGRLLVYWESGDKQPSDDGNDVKYVTNGVGTWLVFLFVIACWIALFAFLPWSVDWYASTYYSDKVGSPEYNRGVWIASWARFYQQQFIAGCIFFMLFVSKSFFNDKHQWNKRQEKLKFRAIWTFTLIGLTVYSGCLLAAAFTDSPDLAYLAFVMSGIGMAVIFPLNGFQSYNIFSLNDNNNNKTVAASPFTCTDYYDHRQKINTAAMIGQIIILSVTYFAFHFNYKWVLVTGSAAGGTAIFLGILLIIVTPYKFEKCDYYDRVPVENLPAMEPILNDLGEPILNDLGEPILNDLGEPIFNDLGEPIFNDLGEPILNNLGI
jgi:predicted secreted protein